MKRIFILCFFIAGFFNVKASHISGSDLSYIYLGSGNYKIILTTFRDCNGIQARSDSLTIKSGQTTFRMALDSISSEDITSVTKSCSQSKCAGGDFPWGLQKNVYYGIVNLGSYNNSCEFTVSWEQSARAGAINTLPSGNELDDRYYTEMLINRCYDSTNSSPQFTMHPLFLVIAGDPISYNPVLIDSMDGYDSLSYEMVLPMSYPGTNIYYKSPFATDAPLTYLGFPKKGLSPPEGFSVDKGANIRFTPMRAGEQTVIVMKVTEWKKINGVMRIVSELKREMMIAVIKSISHVPQTTVFNDFIAHAGIPYTFEIPITDKDSGTFLHTRVISDIPGLSYKVIRDSASKDSKTTLKFEITPTLGMISEKPYDFSVVVNDSSCSTSYGEFIYRYNLFINDGPYGASVIDVNNDLIQVYPVPSKGKVLVSVPVEIEHLNFEWFDMSGRKVGSRTNAENNTEINISIPGIYVLKIFSGNDFIGTKKLVIE